MLIIRSKEVKLMTRDCAMARGSINWHRSKGVGSSVQPWSDGSPPTTEEHQWQPVQTIDQFGVHYGNIVRAVDDSCARHQDSLPQGAAARTR